MRRGFPSIRLGGLLVLTAVAVSLGSSLLTSGSSGMSTSPSSPSRPGAASIAGLGGQLPGALGTPTEVAPDGELVLRPVRSGVLGEADGLLPDRVTVFDRQYPGVTNLNPDLLHALRQAATRAAAEEVDLFVTSGWRSSDYQEELFRQAVAEYGSEAEAAQWVASPGTSAHESGTAVDIGPFSAAAWLSRHGARYGLCQTYRNEPWHYELRPGARDRGCPRMYADASQDPRTQG